MSHRRPFVSVEQEVEAEPIAASPAKKATPPEFHLEKVDPTTVLIEAVMPDQQPATFDDVYDVFSKQDQVDDDWSKVNGTSPSIVAIGTSVQVGTIDKDHLSTTIDNLEEDSAYAFKIDNTTSPAGGEDNQTVKQFKISTKPGTEAVHCACPKVQRATDSSEKVRSDGIDGKDRAKSRECCQRRDASR
jgi:hypothetical protein